MKIPIPRQAVSLLMVLVTLSLAACSPAEQAKQGVTGISDNTQRVAEAALGKQAEVLAHGNLARNDLEQLLVVNRLGKTPSGEAPKNPAAVLITRAAILEKRGGKWTEVLRCDEHLKNPSGYLGGAPPARVTGWRFEYMPDTSQGLEMKFAPANVEAGEHESGAGEPARQTVIVRWNTKVKRYQSLDASHERYLGESPTLETPHSILR